MITGFLSKWKAKVAIFFQKIEKRPQTFQEKFKPPIPKQNKTDQGIVGGKFQTSKVIIVLNP